jgi:hypothetical protein
VAASVKDILLPHEGVARVRSSIALERFEEMPMPPVERMPSV